MWSASQATSGFSPADDVSRVGRCATRRGAGTQSYREIPGVQMVEQQGLQKPRTEWVEAEVESRAACAWTIPKQRASLSREDSHEE